MATRREQTSIQSRELILAAAADLFAEKGYRDTTFAGVAERSGISRGSIPWHFGSKEGLLLAVLERSVEQLNSGLDHPRARVASMTEALVSLFEQPTTRLFVTLLVEALEPDSPIRDRYAAIHEALRGRCRQWLDELPRPAGAATDAPATDALATALVGSVIGIHQQWLVAPDRVDLRQAMAVLPALLAAAPA